MKNRILAAMALTLASGQASATECNSDEMANGETGGIAPKNFVLMNPDIVSGFQIPI